MAYELTDRAWQTPIEGVCKLVYLALCNRAKDHTGQQHYDCWPSIETIAADCGISERCARAHVQWLLEQGYISRRRRGMLTSLYRIVLDKLQFAKDDRQNLPDRPAEFADHDRQNLHTEPASEPVTQSVRKPIPAAPMAQPVVVVNDVPSKLLADWLLVRKSRGRKVLTDSELDDMRAEAAKVGLTLADAIRECITSGWARFKAAWLPTPQAAQEKPVEIHPVQQQAEIKPEQIAPASPELLASIKQAVAAIKSKTVPDDKLAWARQAIAEKRAGKQVAYGRLKMAMDALGLQTWKDVKCAA